MGGTARNFGMGDPTRSKAGQCKLKMKKNYYISVEFPTNPV